MPPVLSPEEQILLILGRAGQVKHPTVLDNIEHCNTLAINTEDIEELIHGLLEYTEQVSDKVGYYQIERYFPCQN